MKSRQYFKTWIEFQIFTTMKLQIVIVWVMTMFSFANGYQRNYMVLRSRRPRLIPKLFMNFQLENNYGNVFRGIRHGVSNYWGWGQVIGSSMSGALWNMYWVMQVFMVRICKHLTQPPSWRATHFRPSATAYSIQSQLSSKSADRCSIRNLRKCHVVVRGTDIS